MRISVLQCTWLFGLVLSFAGQPAYGDRLDDRVEKLLTTHIDGKRNVGAAVGIIRQGATRTWFKGAVEYGEPATPNDRTVFEIGSVSKVFTGVLLASLVLENTVSLTDRVSRYFPELESSRTGSITLLELATHTSGLPKLPPNPSPADPQDVFADYTQTKLVSFLVDYRLGRHPTRLNWNNYSSLGFALLASVLTRASEKSYQELLRTRITEPLDMRDTVVSLDADQSNRFAKPYDSQLNEMLPSGTGVLAGASGIRSTASDLLKFAAANLYPERTPIAKALELAQRLHERNGDNRAGLGWRIFERGKRPVHLHDGGTRGFKAFLGIDSERKVALIYLTNTATPLPGLIPIVFPDTRS